MTSQVFFCCYLVAWLFVWGMAQGSWALVMIHHLTGGAWGLLLRRILEAQMRTLPLLAILFIPIAGSLGYIYPWAQPHGATADEDRRFREWYLGREFFWGRAIVYFL